MGKLPPIPPLNSNYKMLLIEIGSMEIPLLSKRRYLTMLVFGFSHRLEPSEFIYPKKNNLPIKMLALALKEEEKISFVFMGKSGDIPKFIANKAVSIL